MGGRLAKLFAVRPGEGRAVAWHCLTLGLAVGTVILLQAYNDAAFLAVYGADRLPLLFIVSSVALALAATAVGSLVERHDEYRLLTWAAAAAAGSLLGLWAAGRLLPPGFVFASYVVVWVINGLLAIIAWNAVRGAYDTRQSKRLMPVFAAATGLAATLGGLAVRLLAPRLGTESLLLVAATDFALVALLASRRRPSSPAPTAAAAPPSGFWVDAREGFGFVVRNRLVLILTAMLVCSVVVKTVVDYQFKTSLRAGLSKAEMTVYLGNFYAVANAVELLVQLFLSSRLLARFGLTVALLSRPVTLALLAVAGAFHPALGLFAGARMADGVFNRTWYKTGTSLAVAPLAARRAARVKLVQEGTIEPLAVVATSGVLLLVAGGLPLGGLGWITVCVAAVWMALALGVGRRYLGELARAIETRLFDVEQALPVGELLSTSALAQLRRQLAASEPDEVRFALTVVAESGAPLADEVMRLVDHADDGVRLAAAAALAKSSGGAATAGLRRRVALEPDAQVLASLLQALGELGDEGTLELAHRLVADPRPVVKAEALVFLFRHGGLDGILAAAAVLADLRQGSPAERVLLATVLGRLDVAHLDRTLLTLLTDPSPLVRRAALEAAAGVPSPRVQATVVAALADPALAAAAERALVRAGPLGAAAAVTALSGSGFGVSAAAAIQALLRVVSQAPQAAAVGPVLAFTASADRAVRRSALRALDDLARHGLAAPREALTGRFASEVEGAVALRAAVAAAPHGSLWARELTLAGDAAVERLLLLAGLLHDRDEVAPAVVALAGDDLRARANALELLDSRLTLPLEKVLIGLLEARPVGELAVMATAALTRDPTAAPMLATAVREDRWLAMLAAGDSEVLRSVAALAANGLFAGIGLGSLLPLAAAAERQILAPGQSVPAGLALVLSGELATPGASRLVAGDLVGDLELLADLPASEASAARAVTPCELLLVPPAVLVATVEADAALAQSVTRGLLVRIRAASHEEARRRAAA